MCFGRVKRIKEKICQSVVLQLLFLIAIIVSIVKFFPTDTQLLGIKNVERSDLVSFIELIIEAIFCILVLHEFKMTRKSFEWQKEEWERQREEEYCRRVNVIVKWFLPKCFELVNNYNQELYEDAKKYWKEIDKAITSSYEERKLSRKSTIGDRLPPIYGAAFIDKSFDNQREAIQRTMLISKKEEFEAVSLEKKKKLKEDLMDYILSNLQCKLERSEEQEVLKKIIALPISRFAKYNKSFEDLTIERINCFFPMIQLPENEDKIKKNDYIKSDFLQEEIISKIGMNFEVIDSIYSCVKKNYK